MTKFINGAKKKYEFEGPYPTLGRFRDMSGVYAILTRKINKHKYTILDIGESSKVKTRIKNHDRKKCWEKNLQDEQIFYAIHYTKHAQKKGRMIVEQDIRDNNDIVCGKR